MATNSSKLRRNDPILQCKTPLLFAHRGGAGEVPESTEEAFRHMANVRLGLLAMERYDGACPLFAGLPDDPRLHTYLIHWSSTRVSPSVS